MHVLRFAAELPIGSWTSAAKRGVLRFAAEFPIMDLRSDSDRYHHKTEVQLLELNECLYSVEWNGGME